MGALGLKVSGGDAAEQLMSAGKGYCVCRPISRRHIGKGLGVIDDFHFRGTAQRNNDIAAICHRFPHDLPGAVLAHQHRDCTGSDACHGNNQCYTAYNSVDSLAICSNRKRHFCSHR